MFYHSIHIAKNFHIYDNVAVVVNSDSEYSDLEYSYSNSKQGSNSKSSLEVQLGGCRMSSNYLSIAILGAVTIIAAFLMKR